MFRTVKSHYLQVLIMALSWSMSLRLPSSSHVALLNSIAPVLLYAHHKYQMNETRSLATNLTVYGGRRAVRRASYVPGAVPGTPVILTLAIEGRELLTTPVLQVTDEVTSPSPPRWEEQRIGSRRCGSHLSRIDGLSSRQRDNVCTVQTNGRGFGCAWRVVQ